MIIYLLINKMFIQLILNYFYLIIIYIKIDILNKKLIRLIIKLYSLINQNLILKSFQLIFFIF